MNIWTSGCVCSARQAMMKASAKPLPWVQPGLKRGQTYSPCFIQMCGQILYIHRITFTSPTLLELLSLEDSRSCFWLLGWCNNDVIYSDRAVVSQHKWNSGLRHTFLIRCWGTCSFKPRIIGEGCSLGSRLHTWDVMLVEILKLWYDLRYLAYACLQRQMVSRALMQWYLT